ncbi:MAG: BtpA/SgcQ family protein [Planctomycetes bacterium]|nr:BtpA/SgcQ family protein [Planctomycetota bacterium]
MVEIPSFAAIFGRRRPLIGVIHLPPLPGSPRSRGDLKALGDRVRQDARALAAGGASGMLLENFGDAPFLAEHVPPATVAMMTALALIAREAAALPLGVNVLRNDAAAALAVALAGGGAFIRVNVHVGAAVTDQGLLQGRAAATLRLREQLGVGIAVFADVGVKHAAPLAARPLAEEAEEAVHRGLADALIVTGPATGRPAAAGDLAAVRCALPDTPLLAGSGVNPQNVGEVLRHADGLIVGTALKRDGRVEAPIDEQAVRALVAAIAAAPALPAP